MCVCLCVNLLTRVDKCAHLCTRSLISFLEKLIVQQIENLREKKETKKVSRIQELIKLQFGLGLISTP